MDRDDSDEAYEEWALSHGLGVPIGRGPLSKVRREKGLIGRGSAAGTLVNDN